MKRLILLILALSLPATRSLAAEAPPPDAATQAAMQAYNAINERAPTVKPADFPAYLDEILAGMRELKMQFAFHYSMLAGGAFRPIGEVPVGGGKPGEAWREFLRSRVDAALASSATAPTDREIYRMLDVGLVFGTASGKEQTRETIELSNARIESLGADYPASPGAGYFGTLEMMRLIKFDPALADGWAVKLAQSPSPDLAKVGQGRLAVNAGTTKPVESKFTALDGREVDLSQLRGKVVLIDFWATWCAPCVAELPNVKRVYDAYHAKGFEVIGVTLEKASVKPDDSPAVREAKLAPARKKLADYVASKGLPWPQKLEGDFGNDLVTRFNIAAIPATLLLDPSGVIVNSSDIRGEKLEAEVRRLLKL